MKLTSVKAMVAKAMTVGMLAGAFVLATPAKAQAQQFGVKSDPGWLSCVCQLIKPQLLLSTSPLRGGSAATPSLRQQAWERQQAWLHHETWERDHRYGYGYAYRH